MKFKEFRQVCVYLSFMPMTSCGIGIFDKSNKKSVSSVRLSLDVKLPSLPKRFGLADAPQPKPAGLLLKVKDSSGKIFLKSLNFLNSTGLGADFEVSPGPLLVQARYIAAAPGNPQLNLDQSDWQGFACQNPQKISYHQAWGEKTTLVSAGNEAVELSIGNLNQLPLMPGALKHAAGTSTSENAFVTAEDPVIGLALPSACAGKNMVSQQINSQQIFVLQIPVFADNGTPFRYNDGTDAGSRRFVFPAVSTTSMAANMHLLSFDTNDKNLALLAPSANIANDFGNAFLAGLAGGVLPSEICAGKTVLGIVGTAPCAVTPVESLPDCTSDGQIACKANPAFKAVDVTSLNPSVFKLGHTVGGITGNVTIPGVADVRSTVVYGPSIAPMTGNLAARPSDCTTDGSFGCVATSNFKAVDMSLLTPANLKSGVTIASQIGNYPSGINPLTGSLGTDLPSLSSTVPVGAYQFFQSDGTRVTGIITDVGTITPTTTTQTFAASLYRSFTVVGDAELVPSKILDGIEVFGVIGNVTLPAANTVRTGQSFGSGSGINGVLPDCSSEGQAGCVGSAPFVAANTNGLANKVLLGQNVAGVVGNVTLPAITDVRTATSYGVSGTGLTGAMAPAAPDCTTDGQINCTIPGSGTLKSADTANFTGWDIRKKRSGTTPFAPLTFGGLTSQAKSHCRNQARTVLWDYLLAPGSSGLDFFDTIDDANNGLVGLPGTIPAWTMMMGDGLITQQNDFKCGGIYATGSVNSGNTGADATILHDNDGNWQDLTPGVIPASTVTNSTNTANGCNATDKHCVFKELMSGLMVSEVSAATYDWSGAIGYCDSLGEVTGAVTSPIPIIDGATYTDWRLPTQKELTQLYNSGIRGLNQTTTMQTNFGNIAGSYFWSASTVNTLLTSAWSVNLHSGNTGSNVKTSTVKALCVR